MTDEDREHAGQRLFTPPTGMAALQFFSKQEDDCESATDIKLPSMGKKIPLAVELIGTAFSLLDRMASCWWACRQNDHVEEYVCGRIASTGRATLRLIKLGFYDEALTLCRSLDEIANLVFLFQLEPQSLAEWKAATRSDRIRNFGPAAVRKRIEALGESAPITEERYRILCEISAHVHPATRPQQHNALGLPHAGGFYQENGVVVCINELALGLSICTAFAALQLGLERSVQDEILKTSKELLENIGAATITEIDDFYASLRADQRAGPQLEEARQLILLLQEARRTSPPPN